MSANRRNEAFHLFCSGLSLRKVAESLGVHRSTTERWSAEERWVERREQIWQQAREESLMASQCTYKIKLDAVYDSVQTLLLEAVAERRMYMQGRLSRRKMRISNQMFLSFAKAYAEIENGFIRNLGQRFGSS